MSACKTDPNFKILLSHWLTFKFSSFYFQKVEKNGAKLFASLRSIEFIVVVDIRGFNFDKIFAISKNAGQATRWRWDRSRSWCRSFSQFIFKGFSNKRSKVLNDSDGQGLSVQRVGGGS